MKYLKRFNESNFINEEKSYKWVDEKCCLEIDTPGSSDTIWSNVDIEEYSDYYEINIKSDDLKLNVMKEDVESVTSSEMIISNGEIEIFITKDNGNGSFKPLKSKTKTLLEKTFKNINESYSDDKIRNLKKYIVMRRGMTDGIWILEKREDGLYIYDEYSYNDDDDEPEWNYWSSYSEFLNNWFLDEDDEDYEDDFSMTSYDTFEEAYDDIKS